MSKAPLHRAGRLGLLVVSLLMGCATGDGMQTKLQDASGAYNRHLRWGDIDRASEYLPTASRDAFLANYEDMRGRLVIVDYQVTRLQLEKQRGVAHSRAEISWHTDDRLIVETTWIDQTWQWYEGAFVLVDEFRSSGTPLSVFAEPGDAHPYLPGLDAYRLAHGIGENSSEATKPPETQARRPPPA